MWIDLIVLGLLLFFIWRGAQRGFLLSLTGPVSFGLTGLIAYIYYNSSKNALVSLSILLLGPLLLNWFLRFLIRSFDGASEKTAPSLISGILGAVVTVCWGMTIVLPIIFLILFIPVKHPQVQALQKYIKTSGTFMATKPLMARFNFVPPPPAQTASGAKSPALIVISNDSRMQALMNNPNIIQAIKDKNYAALISDPKVLEMAQDPEFAQKLLAAYGEMQQEITEIKK
jgi:uncharacterized membrane protein required for colicin V production